MRVYTTLTAPEIRKIAADLGIAADTSTNTQDPNGRLIHRGKHKGKYCHTFVLRPVTGADNPYQRVRTDGSGHKVGNAVCWHGHADFMSWLMFYDPDATIQTGVANYIGQQDFIMKYPETAWQNIGSMYAPCTMAEACTCDYAGNPWHHWTLEHITETTERYGDTDATATANTLFGKWGDV